MTNETEPNWEALLADADRPCTTEEAPAKERSPEELDALRERFIVASRQDHPRPAIQAEQWEQNGTWNTLFPEDLKKWLQGETKEPPNTLDELENLLDVYEEKAEFKYIPYRLLSVEDRITLLLLFLKTHGDGKHLIERAQEIEACEAEIADIEARQAPGDEVSELNAHLRFMIQQQNDLARAKNQLALLRESPTRKAERLEREANNKAEQERLKDERRASEARAREEEIAALVKKATPLDEDAGYAALEAFEEADLPEGVTGPMLRKAVAATSRLTDIGVDNLLEKVPSVNHLLSVVLSWFFTEELSELLDHSEVKRLLKKDFYVLALWEAVHGPEGLIAEWQKSQATSTPEACGIEPDWIAPGFLERGDLIELSAQHKSGKSWLNLGCAVDLAMGRVPFTGEDIEGSPPRVAYIDLENGERITSSRLHELWKEPSANFAWRHYGGLSVLEPGTLHELETFLAFFCPDVICIGSAMNLMTGTPEGGNSPETARAYSLIAALLKRWQVKGWSVILEHHLTSSGASSVGTNTLDKVMTHIVTFKNGKLSLAARDPRPVWAEVGQLVREFPESEGRGGRWIPKASKAKTQPAPEPEVGTSRAQTKVAKKETAEQRRARIRNHRVENPDDSARAISDALGIARSTVSRDLAALREETS